MTNKMSILDLLRSDGSIVVNKKLAQTIGLNEAVIYSELISKFIYWQNRGQLVEGGWFFCTVENLEEDTTLKRDAQSRAIKRLENKFNLIETKRMGLPAKRYFRITENIFNFFSNDLITEKQQSDEINVPTEENRHKPHRHQIAGNPTTRKSENRQQQGRKTVSNNTNYNNTKINKDDDDDMPIKSEEIHSEKNQSETPEEINAIVETLKDFTKDDLSKRSFDAVLLKVMDMYQQEKIGKGNFRSYLMSALSSKIQELEARRKEDKHMKNNNNNRKPEIIPEWFENQQQLLEETESQDTQSNDEDLAERRRKLREELDETRKRKDT